MKILRLIPLAVVVLCGFLAFTNSIHLSDAVAAQHVYTIEFSQRVVGIVAATIGLLGILWQWTAKASVSEIVPSAVVLLAGLSLTSESWPPVMAIAAVLAASLLMRPVRKET